MLTIEKLVCGLAAWLHIRAGASRTVANAVLQAVTFILNTVITLLVAAMASHGVKVKIPPLNLPRDVRSAYRNHFPEPKCERRMCCPKCLNIITFQPDKVPLTCDWKASQRSRPCGAALWKPLRTRKGPKSVEICLITTQSLLSWLPSFLSSKIIDDALHSTYQRQAGEQQPEMRDVQDSPGWRGIFGEDRGPYDLVFGIYIDWFQVFKLKIAGENNIVTAINKADPTHRQKSVMRSNRSLLPELATAFEISTGERLYRRGHSSDLVFGQSQYR